MHHAVDQQKAGDEDHGDQRIHRAVVIQADDAEQRRAGHLLDAVLAAGERRLDAEEIDHLRQREGDHG